MTTDSQSTNENEKARSQDQIINLGSFLELLPFPGVLIHPNSQLIQMANSKVSELALFTRAELKGMHASQLFRNWDHNNYQNIFQSKIPKETTGIKSWDISDQLISRNKTTIPIRLIFGPIFSPFETVLVIIEAHKSEETPIIEEINDQIWQGVSILVNAFSEDDFEIALDKSLQAGKIISGANYLGIYQAQSKRPELELQASLEPIQLFPESLSAQDLVNLNKPRKWVFGKGKRPTGLLYRTTHESHFSYISSAPLGQPNAMIGLFVIGDTMTSPRENILEITQFLANFITALIQKHVWKSKNEKELEAQERQIWIGTLLEEQSHEGILILNPNLTIQSLNDSAELMLGYAKSEIQGQPIEKVLIGKEFIMPAFSDALEGKPTHNLGNLHLYHRNGDAFLALVRIFPVMKKGNVENIVVFIQDLSKQEQIQIQAQQLEQRALLGEVTAIFAHEIRNPINNISTGLQLLEMNMPKEDPNRDCVERMITDCDRLAELIKSVLAYSRPTDYEMQALDLGILMKRLLERLHPRITHLNVVSELEVEPDCPQILGNARALEQVFNNLITNSLQSMDKNGGNLAIRIKGITTFDNENYIEARIADTGPGIPDEIQKHIFQPFFTTKEHGTGLGLAISKRIILAHKGTIDLESFPGGSIFSIRFPIAKSFA